MARQTKSAHGAHLPDDPKSAHSAHLPASPELLMQATQSLHVDIPDSEQDLKDLLIAQENALARASVKQGFCFMALKDRIGHGNFQTWLQEHKFNARSVQEKMQAARFVMSLPADAQPKLVDLGHKKLIALAQAEPDVIDAVLGSGDDIDDLAELNYQDLRKKIRKLESACSDLTADLDTAKTREKELRKKITGQLSNGDYPDFVVAARHESSALAEKALLCLDDLEQACSELEQMTDSNNSPQYAQHRDIAATSIYVHAHAVFARSAALMTRILGSLRLDVSKQLKDGLAPGLLYSEAEIAHAVELRELMIGEHKQEAALREAKREREKPAKPGRPKNSAKGK